MIGGSKSPVGLMICSAFTPPDTFLFVSGRGRADKDRLINQLTELVELQWTVVERRRQAEAVFHQ